MKISRGIKENGEKFIVIVDDCCIQFGNNRGENLERAIAAKLQVAYTQVNRSANLNDTFFVKYGDCEFSCKIKEVDLFFTNKQSVQDYFSFIKKEFESWRERLPYTEEFEV